MVAKKWTKVTIAKDAKKYSSRFEWAKASQCAYRVAGQLGIRDKVCKHMEKLPPGPAPTIHPKRVLMADAKKYQTRSEWKRMSTTLYLSALKHGDMDKYCAHMVNPWGLPAEESKNYQKFEDWTKATRSYKAALRNVLDSSAPVTALLSRYCSHMDIDKMTRRYAKERISKDIAKLKYQKRKRTAKR